MASVSTDIMVGGHIDHMLRKRRICNIWNLQSNNSRCDTM